MLWWLYHSWDCVLGSFLEIGTIRSVRILRDEAKSGTKDFEERKIF